MLSTEDEFAALLRRHIQEQELGVNELARRAGISNATISRLLTQRRTPRMATASKIAHALGFDTVEGMLRGEPRRTPPAEGGTAARPTAEVRPTVQQSSGYALAVPVVGRGHAGPGGGSDEPYVFVPLDTAQGRQVLSL
ncbi:MAG: hypothetical protein CL878_14775, partial [Dehalococcoidia bacterium]|nr:hypothetical protein [Dehalococcoidia bacterium]